MRPIIPENYDSDKTGDAELEAAMAQLETEDRESRVVARLDHASDPKSVKLERELSPEMAAQLIAELSAKLASVSPEGAEIVRRVAEQVAYLRGDAVVARAREEHVRARDAAERVTPHADGERAWLLANRLRDAARPLAALNEGEPAGAAERQAVAWARQDPALAALPDGELLAVLRRFALERQRWCPEARKYQHQSGLSADDEASIVRSILGADAGNSAKALAKGMQRASKGIQCALEKQLTRMRDESHESEDTNCRENESAGTRTMPTCNPNQALSSSAESSKPRPANTGSTSSRQR
jgi:hypothetical protein